MFLLILYLIGFAVLTFAPEISWAAIISLSVAFSIVHFGYYLIMHHSFKE